MGGLAVDQLVNVIASGLVFLACAGFAATYHRLAPWWRSDIGRNLMAFAGAVGMLCLYTMLITEWPEGCMATVLRSCRVAVLVAIAALMAQRTRMVVRAQRERRGRSGV
ncbi:putative phage holin [Streptomyces cucumeris]|uniref:putative phage holin n=1 Tax=Streptomyces cucumeris TaxID=2962890 RepID=UPI003D161220